MILQNIRERASINRKHIVLPEGEDPRSIEAAEVCATENVAKITLLGREDVIKRAAEKGGFNPI